MLSVSLDITENGWRFLTTVTKFARRDFETNVSEFLDNLYKYSMCACTDQHN